MISKQRVFKEVLKVSRIKKKTIKGSEKEDKEVVITLLSNGSTNLFKENTLTLFSNRLHTPIFLNPSNTITSPYKK